VPGQISITVANIEEGHVDDAIAELQGAADDFRDQDGATRFDGYVDRDRLIAIGVAEYESEPTMRDVEGRPSAPEAVGRLAAGLRGAGDDPDRDLKDPGRAPSGIAQRRAERTQASRSDILMVLNCELVASWS
jgi:quinol monooxygenase YgiN